MTAGIIPSIDPDPETAPSLRREWVISRLNEIRDPQARLGWIVERARRRAPLEDRHRLDANRVAGCLVRIWWVAEFDEGRCRFRTDSDAVTLKAIGGLVADICSGGRPDEIVAVDFGFFDSLGLMRQLAESRQATVRRIVESARDFAAARR